MNAQIGTGDDGKTSLFSGRRVFKSHPRIEIVGTLDELQSILGILLSKEIDQYSRKVLENLPHLLFDIGGEIAGEEKFLAENITLKEVQKMEEWIDFFDTKLPKLHEFILANGSEEAEWISLARAATRKLERLMQPLFEEEGIRTEVFQFVNRLSRLLFSVGRWENDQKKDREITWKKGKKLPNAPK